MHLSIKNRGATFLCSKLFYQLTLLLFVFSAIFFALVINTGDRVVDETGTEVIAKAVGPDEFRHVGNIEYYAKRPLLAGPVIKDADPQDLWLGEIERFPSYLYYYLASFPVKITSYFNLSLQHTVLVLRLLNIIVGLIGLTVFYKFLRIAKLSPLVVNVSTFLLANTGMYIWVSSSVTYDIHGVVLFFLFLLASLKAIRNKDPVQFFWMSLWSLIGGITKYTYIPFFAIGMLITIILYIKSIERPFNHFKKHIATFYGQHSIKAGLLAIFLIISAVLFIERIGINLFVYNSYNPECNKVQTTEDCMRFEIFKRNYTQEIEYERGVREGTIPRWQYQPFEFTANWLKMYYASLYFYISHIRVPRLPDIAFIAVSLLELIILGALAVKRKKILKNNQQKLLAATLAIYVSLTYLFNVKITHNFGVVYAQQGRYLLPVIGIFYALVLMLFISVWKDINLTVKRFLKIPLVIFFAILIIAHFPLISFFWYANSPEWYTDSALKYLPSWLVR